MLESSIPERPFVNNVYRRSLAFAPPRRFPGVQLNSLPTYRRALLSERLEQAIHLHKTQNKNLQERQQKKAKDAYRLVITNTKPDKLCCS